MLKKIFLGLLLTGFIGILVWGGVYRTQAKSNNNAGRNLNSQGGERVEYAEGNGAQTRDNRDLENSTDEEGFHGSLSGPTNRGITESSGMAFNDKSEDQAKPRGQGSGNRGGRGNRNGQGSGSELLTATEFEALNLALNDEYHALANYQSVITTFGEIEPFVEIATSEQRHIDALVNQFNKHGLQVPENSWTGNVTAFDSLQQACQMGVESELANAYLYDQLSSMTDDPSLLRVFSNLSNASLNSHLPLFEACR